MRLIDKAFVGIAGLLVSFVTCSIPLSGGISFDGAAGSSVGFDFYTNEVWFNPTYPGGNAEVQSATDDLDLEFDQGDIVSFYNFNYGSVPGPAAFSLFSGTGDVSGNLTFEVTSVDIISETTLSPTITAEVLALGGEGSWTDGADTVSGFWTFTSNNVLSNFSFSTSNGIYASAPEPAFVSLLCISLAGVGFGLIGPRRNRRK